MKDIFMVQLDWSTTDADGIDTELYEDYGDAYDRYKEIITEQLKNFWQGEVVFDTDGDPGKDYEFSEEDNNSNESEVYWHLSLKDDYYFHTFVDLLRVPLYTKHEDSPVFTVRYGGSEYTFTEGAKALIATYSREPLCASTQSKSVSSYCASLESISGFLLPLPSSS